MKQKQNIVPRNSEFVYISISLHLKLWLRPASCSNCSQLSVAFSEKQKILVCLAAGQL